MDNNYLKLMANPYKIKHIPKELPKINFNVGTGAVIRPILTKEIPQTKVVEVIDCVT